MLSKLSSGPSLRQFIQRKQVLKLYRDMMKAISCIDDVRYKDEMRAWARYEFKTYKAETDENTIRMHVTRGKKVLREFEGAVNMAK